MGVFSDLLNSSDEKKPTKSKSKPQNKFYYNPDLNFKKIYVPGLSILGMTTMYLKSGRFIPTMTGALVAGAFAFQTHEYINWHRVRYGNYMRAKMMEKQVKEGMDPRNIEARFEARTGKQLSEYNKDLIK